MLGYMNKESLKRTLASGDVWFYSRSRQELWHKGETSGNFLRLKSIIKDCDSDTLLIKAEPAGPVCHTGNRTCFFQQLEREDTA
jgi:phosphoribosyl-AMP cyclohydrolase